MSGTSDRIGAKPVDVAEWAEFLQGTINEAKCLTRANSKSRACECSPLPMVPEPLRGVKSEAYEPKIMSLGPHHRNKPDLQAMKHIKLLFLGDFLARNENISLKEYLEKVKDEESKAREAYAENCKMESKDLVVMLLLDCCFVLEIMWFWNEMPNYLKQEDIYIPNPSVGIRYFVKDMARDMLLLENQLPFFLIRLLFECVTGTTNSLEALITKFFKTIVPGIMKVPSNDGNREFRHILHFVHSTISLENSKRQHVFSGGSGVSDGCCRIFMPPASSITRPGGSKDESVVDWRIPCATKLRNAGIHFVRKDEKERHIWRKLWKHICNPSETRVCSFLDITFKEGRIEIPKLTVDNDTETVLRNLIAFEHCCFKGNVHVTAYVELMNRIINTEADVELLQQSRVLVNRLRDDRMGVVSLFKNLCKEVPMLHKCYPEVYNGVHRHCHTKCNIWRAKCYRWRARLNHDYFTSPWAIVALIAASLILVLTLTQTIMSVVSYVKPKQI